MSTELLYTSAPHGLRHGAKGFCTVLSTAGMSINVISKLESISGYRQFFSADHPRYAENPIAYAHQIFSVGGIQASVISRIGPYGIDYTGRPSNKIAHHVVVEPNEMPAAGPAWLLGQSVIRSQWLGHCETPSSGPDIPSGNQSSRICTQWRNLAGDAGWGGVVAEAVASADQTPLWIIYSLSQRDRLLELMDESIALLPVSLRWRATFNTFAVKVPPDVQCKIRFVPEGTEEAKLAASGKKAIDLTKPPRITTASRWVELARGTAKPDPVAPIQVAPTEETLEAPAEIETAWSDPDDGMGSHQPPPTPGPPELPPEASIDKGSKKNILIAVSVIGFLGLALTTWLVATQLSDTNAAKLPQPISPPMEPDEPIETPAPSIIALETVQLDVRYDQKQAVRLILAGLEPARTDAAPTELPTAIEMRGVARLPSSRRVPADDQSESTVNPTMSDPDEDSAELNRVVPSAPDSIANDQVENDSADTMIPAAFVAWGADPFSLPEAESYLVNSTKLVNAQRTLDAHPLPTVPPQVSSIKFFWEPKTRYLIADASLSLESPPEKFADQIAAYQRYVRSFSVLMTKIDTIRKANAELPNRLKMIGDDFLFQMKQPNETLRHLWQEIPSGNRFPERVNAFRQQLQDRLDQLRDPLTKQQQAATISIVSVCGEIVLTSKDAREAFSILKSGQTIDVPELVFFDADRAVIDRIPLRIHFSW
ncbi:hypothetical protein U8335_21615 [Roseiconus lacunae]|uniref:GAP1-N2 domain-containing protein n=1 Tax=Roseiconus lacunae TaxID=2605694 RepID=UPI003085F033|nr:hypothetical protein U8335_21615 [Stieleria sp. HD01]